LINSAATIITVDIFYGGRTFRLRCRDNGVGISKEILQDGARRNHWGLRGMRERAASVGASFQIWSGPGNGTEIETQLAASAAYAGQKVDSHAGENARLS
jgi:signal transduction histidine kinase